MDTIREYLNDLKKTIDMIPVDDIEIVSEVLRKAKNIYVFGNGGSGATASHMVNDFSKGLGLRIFCLNDNVSLLTAYANDVSYDHVFMQQLNDYLDPEDVVIGISGSGNSMNILNAINLANSIRAITIGFCGYDGGELKKIAQYSVHIPADMQITEDLHLVVCHLIYRLLQ